MEEGAEGGEQGQAGSADAALNPSDRWRARSVAAAPYLVVTAVSLWLTRAYWLPGSYVVAFDSYAYSGPNLEVTERALRAGRLPVLNDLIFGGVPHLGNPSAAAFYPPQVITLFLETNRSMGILVAGHVVILGIGMVLLLRRLDIGRVGAGAAGVALVCAGATLTKTVQFEQILVIAWAPLLLAAIHAVLTSERPWRAVAAMSATTAAVLLAGHPQLVYEVVVLALAATVGFAVDDARWRRLPHLALGAVLGACIALPQLVAVLFATSDSAITAGRDLDSLMSPALSVQFHALPRAVLGTVQDRDPASFAGGFESIGFVGVVVAVFAVIGTFHAVMIRRSRPWAIAFAVTALLAVVWALGPRTFVFRFAYDVVPGFDLARASARWMTIVVVIVALFAGVGVDAVVNRVNRWHVAAAGASVAILAGAIVLGPFDAGDRRGAVIWSITAILAVALVAVAAFSRRPTARTVATVAVVVLAGVELAAMSLHSIPQVLRTDTPFTAHGTATTRWLADQDAGSTIAFTDDGAPVAYQVPGLRPNANVLHEIRSLDGYDGGVQVTQRWADALYRFTPSPPLDLPLRNSVQIPADPDALGRLGVRFILLDRDRPADDFLPGWEGPRAVDEDFEVWENPSWIGDAVAWPNSRTVDGRPADALRDDGDDRDDRDRAAAPAAIVDREDAVLDCGDTADCAPTGLTVDRRSPEHLVIETDVELPTIVSVDQQALSGWSVEIDGEPADRVLVDGLFLGVEVPAGSHTITWRYHSPWLGLTLAISLFAVAATIGLLVLGTLGRGGETHAAARGEPQVAGGTDRQDR